MKQRWEETSRNLRRFNLRQVWLESKLGRRRDPGKPKEFSESSLKTKKRQITEFVAGWTSDELYLLPGWLDSLKYLNSSFTPHQAPSLNLDSDLSQKKFRMTASQAFMRSTKDDRILLDLVFFVLFHFKVHLLIALNHKWEYFKHKVSFNYFIIVLARI